MSETIENDEGYVAEIETDDCVDEPDFLQDEDCFIVTTRNRYFELEYKHVELTDLVDAMAQGKRYCGYLLFPVYAYVHGGVALSLGRGYPFDDKWDSGMIGVIALKYENEQALVTAESVINCWNQYLSGDIYSITIKNPIGELIDSCCGFYGFEYAKQEANRMLTESMNAPVCG